MIFMQAKTDAFADYTPSAFVVGTPFQVLCMYEAIQHFQISNYKIIIPFSRQEVRNHQTLAMLDYFNLKYELYDENEYRAKKLLFSAKVLGNSEENKYPRVFIGNYKLLLYRAIALSLLKRDGNVVYLDDGNASLNTLKGEEQKVSLACNILEKFASLLAWHKNIALKQNFFSIYSDVETRKNVCANKFEGLKALMKEGSSNQDTAFFIGTNPEMFNWANGLTVSQYENFLTRALNELKDKYGNLSMIYIPHGRDNSDFAKKLCNSLGIEYRRLNEAVELSLVKENVLPKAVIGFTSSALFNIKKIIPEAKVLNYTVENESAPKYLEYSEISKYYMQNGIKLIKIPIKELN